MSGLQLSDEDLECIKQAVLYPIVLDVLQRDIDNWKADKTTPIKMKHVYIRTLRKAQNDIVADNYEVRKEMRKRGLKIYEEKREEHQVRAKYLCRGYRHDFSMLWLRVKAEVEMKIAQVLGVDLTDEKTDP